MERLDYPGLRVFRRLFPQAYRSPRIKYSHSQQKGQTRTFLIFLSSPGKESLSAGDSAFSNGPGRFLGYLERERLWNSRDPLTGSHPVRDSPIDASRVISISPRLWLVIELSYLDPLVFLLRIWQTSESEYSDAIVAVIRLEPAPFMLL